MSDEAEDEANSDNCLPCYGIEPGEEIPLPNFKNAPEQNEQFVISIIEANLPPELLYRGYVRTQLFTFGFDEVELRIKVNFKDTNVAIFAHVHNNEYQLSRKTIDTIRWALRDITAQEAAQNGSRRTVLDAGLIVLRLLEETASFLQAHRQGLQDAEQKARERYWNLSKTNNITPLLNHELEMKGVDLDTVHGAATHILGKTPAQICHDILPNWRILHCENVLRSDLKRKFLQQQQSLREKLVKIDMKELRTCVPKEHRRSGDGLAAREQLVDYLTKPRLTFHGTRRELVPSIVQHGFLKPGDCHPVTKRPLSVDNGSVYGRGIYSSPQAWYAMLYSDGDDQKVKPSQLPGRKLIVCATLMGRTACMGWGDRWWDMTEPFPGADSHVNPSQYAYIVFNSAQILPCYVLHLDYTGKEETDDLWDWLMQNEDEDSDGEKEVDKSHMPGEKQRKKEELIAKGQKFFAYGYGPIIGNKLVVEDVADVDDDEEDYGEYQLARADIDTGTGGSIWDNDWGREICEGKRESWDDQGELEGTTAFDEYAKARKVKLNRRNPKSI